MDAPITITLTPEQADLIRGCLESRRQDIDEPSQFDEPDPQLAMLEELQALLSGPAVALPLVLPAPTVTSVRGEETRPSSRLDRLWAVFAPRDKPALCDVFWACTVNDLRLHAIGGGAHPEAVFTEEIEARLYAQKLLLKHVDSLHQIVAALGVRW